MAGGGHRRGLLVRLRCGVSAATGVCRLHRTVPGGDHRWRVLVRLHHSAQAACLAHTAPCREATAAAARLCGCTATPRLARRGWPRRCADPGPGSA
jgi:hypothetical protein